MSCNPHYFCVQDILATQERTLCKFLMETPKLGELQSGIETTSNILQYSIKDVS